MSKPAMVVTGILGAVAAGAGYLFVTWIGPEQTSNASSVASSQRAADAAEKLKARVARHTELMKSPQRPSEEERLFICRAAIATLMQRDVRAIRARSQTDGTIQTDYQRASDRTHWTQRCRFAGSSVEWASVDAAGITGRWRTDPADGRVTYRIEGGTVVITESRNGYAHKAEFSMEAK